MLIRNSIVTALYLLAWVGTGCAGSSHPTTIVCGTCEEPSRFVRLQTRPLPSSSEIQGGFAHPLKLSPESWKLLLGSVHVRPVINVFMSGDEQPAFTQEEIDYLSMTLSRAFAQASPDQWVVFGLSHPVLSSGSEMTTGAWYVEGTKLHLLLPNFHAPVRMDNVREVLNRDPMFEMLNATRYEFLPTEYADEGSGTQTLLSFVRDETPHLAIEYQVLLARGRAFQEAQERESLGAQSVNPGEIGSPSSSLDDRLTTLNRLKEQHLITEDDYQRKKQALLDQL